MVFKDNLGSDLMITSHFGEMLLGYYLVKKGLFVVSANTEGCDLFVMDKKGKVFKGRKNKNKMIGIEIKTRQNNSPSFPFDGWNTNYSSKFWDFEPYLSIVTRKEIIILSLEILKSKKVRTKNESISLSKLKKQRENIRFKNKIIYLEWQAPTKK